MGFDPYDTSHNHRVYQKEALVTDPMIHVLRIMVTKRHSPILRDTPNITPDFPPCFFWCQNCFFAKFDANERRQVLLEVLKKMAGKSHSKNQCIILFRESGPWRWIWKKYDDLKFGSAEYGIVLASGTFQLQSLPMGFDLDIYIERIRKATDRWEIRTLGWIWDVWLSPLFLKTVPFPKAPSFPVGFPLARQFPESKSSTNSFLRFPGLAAAVWDQKKLAKQRGRHTNVGQLHVIYWEWISMKYWSSHVTL